MVITHFCLEVAMLFLEGSHICLRSHKVATNWTNNVHQLDKYGHQLDKYGHQLDKYGYPSDICGHQLNKYGHQRAHMATIQKMWLNNACYIYLRECYAE